MTSAFICRGNQLEGWLAPEITGNKRQGVGAWSNEELVDYLKTGANDKTVAAGPMAEAVHNSATHEQAGPDGDGRLPEELAG